MTRGKRHRHHGQYPKLRGSRFPIMTAPGDGETLSGNQPRNGIHQDMVPFSVAETKTQFESIAWDAEVAEAERTSTSGLYVGRLVISGKFLDRAGKLSRHLRQRDAGATALVPFGLRYVGPLDDGQGFIDRVSEEVGVGKRHNIGQDNPTKIQTVQRWDVGGTAYLGFALNRSPVQLFYEFKSFRSRGGDSLAADLPPDAIMPFVSLPADRTDDIEMTLARMMNFARYDLVFGPVSSFTVAGVALSTELGI